MELQVNFQELYFSFQTQVVPRSRSAIPKTEKNSPQHQGNNMLSKQSIYSGPETKDQIIMVNFFLFLIFSSLAKAKKKIVV